MKIIELGNREDLGNLDGSCDWKIETEKGNFTLKATNSFSEVAESDQYSKESKLLLTDEKGEVAYSFEYWETNDLSGKSVYQSPSISDDFLKEISDEIFINLSNEKEVLVEKIKEKYQDELSELPFEENYDEVRNFTMKDLQAEAVKYSLKKNVEDLETKSNSEFFKGFAEGINEYITTKIDSLYPKSDIYANESFVVKHGEELGINNKNGIISNYEKAYDENSSLYLELANNEISNKIHQLTVEPLEKLQGVDLDRKSLSKVFAEELAIDTPNFLEIRNEENQKFYNKIRNKNEELLEIGELNTSAVTKKEFELLSGGIQITDNEIKNLENKYNIEHGISNMEKHVEEHHNKYFNEKEEVSLEKASNKSKSKDIEKEF